MRRGGSRGVSIQSIRSIYVYLIKVKRTGGDFGGPVSKRGGHGHDFSSDTF
jgi:hypothetical protein